jgi:hypothetical protein
VSAGIGGLHARRGEINPEDPLSRARQWPLYLFDLITMDLAHDAARWIILLETRLASLSEVVAWADGRIVAAGKPHPLLIEISTSRENDFHDVIGHLRNLSQAIDELEALRYALPTIRLSIERGTLRAERAAGITYRYLNRRYSELPGDLQALFSADDEFSLAIEESYGDRNEIEHRFLAALRQAERS